MAPDAPRPDGFETPDAREPNYVRAAFHNQYNWIMLAAVAGFSLLSLNPLPLVIGAGAELMYLSVVSQNQRFQRLVRAKLGARRREVTDEQLHEALGLLTPDRRDRFNSIERMCAAIRENYRQLSAGSQMITNQMQDRLDGLRMAFLRLLIAGQQHGEYLKNFDAAAIDKALGQLNNADAGSDKVAAINQKRIEILHMRLEKLKRIRENRQLIEAQSAAIEDVLGLIRDQSITMHDPQSVSDQLGELVQDVEHTESSVREVESLFDSPTPEEVRALPPDAIPARPPAGKAKA